MPQVNDEGTSRADIISFQPRPINCNVIHRPKDDVTETIIARVWWAKHARACRLCTRCSATVNDDGVTALCQKSTLQHVAFEDAELFRDLSDGVLADDRHAGAAAR